MALNPNIAKAIARRQVNELRENNKLIADFMGKDHELNQCISAPLYHKEWNWLMPVVEKIESPKHWFNCGQFLNDEEIEFTGEWYCVISEKPHFKGLQYVDVTGCSSKIEATYKAVVEFIKWYNEKED